MKLLSDTVYQVATKILGRRDPNLAELIMRWPKIVGIECANHTFPIKISHSIRNKKRYSLLIIGAKNASLSTEISFLQDVIVERIAIYLGFQAIHAIKIVIRG